MLITFKSPAGGDVIMFGKNASQILQLLGREPQAPQGIFTVEQIPAAITALTAAIAEDKARQPPHEEDDQSPEHKGMTAPVSLAQRAWPLLDLLQLALKDRKPVTWGV